MKNLLILGGGLAGTTLAYLLKEKYPNSIISIIEEDKIGGLCITETYKGLNYDLGPHILYTDREHLKNFFNKFIENNEKKFYQWVSIDGKLDNLYHYPAIVGDVIKINPKSAVELYNIEKSKPDFKTLESFLLSQVGRTAYEYFFKNYNIKQWGVHPKKMETEWVKQRKMFLRDDVDSVFGNKWSGHPGSYMIYFDKIIKDIKIIKEKVIGIDLENNKVKTNIREYNYDFVFNTTPIDILFGSEPLLKYRGITWVYAILNKDYVLPTYLTSFPNNYNFTRIMEYKHTTQQIAKDKTIISFEFPFDPSDTIEPTEDIYVEEALDFIKNNFGNSLDSYFKISKNLVYPLAEKKESDKFWNIINSHISNNFITLGRLGLYTYISMDTCVDQCIQVISQINSWGELSKEEKLNFYKQLKERQT